MPLFWLASDQGGERRFFIQEATWPIFAFIRSSIAGFPGPIAEHYALDAKTARKVPKGMIGHVLSGKEARALLERIG